MVMRAHERPVLTLGAEVLAGLGVGHRLLTRAARKRAAAVVAVRVPPGAAVLDIVPAPLRHFGNAVQDADWRKKFNAPFLSGLTR